MLHGIVRCNECNTSLEAQQFYTTRELAKWTKLHRSTVQRLFVDEEGVVKLGCPTRRGKRQYFTLRIPQSVVERVFRRMTVGG
jgi:hypothetical protein